MKAEKKGFSQRAVVTEEIRAAIKADKAANPKLPWTVLGKRYGVAASTAQRAAANADLPPRPKAAPPAQTVHRRFKPGSTRAACGRTATSARKPDLAFSEDWEAVTCGACIHRCKLKRRVPDEASVEVWAYQGERAR